MSPDDYTTGVQLRLAQLYAAGLTLPWRSTPRTDENDNLGNRVALAESKPTLSDLDRLSHEEWRRVYEDIGSRLAGPDMYMEMFDPFGWDEEPVVGSLADDLADIYQEIRAGLLQWRRGAQEDAAWTWRFGFETHWAQHATGAMRALQALVFRYEFAPPRPSTERPNER